VSAGSDASISQPAKGVRDIERIGCSSRGAIYGLACGAMPMFAPRINAQPP